MTAALKFENISETTADISLSSVPRIRIKEDTVELNKAAGNDAADLSIATMKDVRSNQRMFEIIAHNGPLEKIPAGTLPANGQQFYAALYPEAAEALENGHQFIVSELLWNTGVVGNPDAYKGCFSLGGEDENGRWYRLPKLNADSSEGYRAPFLRGSEIGVDAGKLVLDQMQGHVHGFSSPVVGDAPGGSRNLNAGPNYPATDRTAGPITDGVNGTPRTGPETAPRYHGVIMCIRMFGTASNPGSVDAAQLATDLAIANAKIQALEDELDDSVGFTIIYPNGGTEAESHVAANSTYLLTNPFPGHHVICKAELYYNGEWGTTGWIYTTGGGGYGVNVDMLGDNLLVVTGSAALGGARGPHGGTLYLPNNYATPTPCRVKVWKVKGAT